MLDVATKPRVGAPRPIRMTIHRSPITHHTADYPPLPACHSYWERHVVAISFRICSAG